MDGVRLLKYPFPYETAATVNSDNDGATVERFNAVHAPVNGTRRLPSDSRTLELLLPRDADATGSSEAARDTLVP